MSEHVRIGYIPLLDAALLFAARDAGFAQAHGLELDLVREVSWANIRDRLQLGLFDAAHMLAPAAIASSLGLAQMRVPLVAPVALNLNGNAITVSPGLRAAIAAAAEGDMRDPAVTARALARVIADRAGRGDAPVTFGHVFPFSTHHYQLRHWLKGGGIDPDRDVSLVVLPPPYMADALQQGQLDGFCVGAPWNSLAVRAGAGRILHLGTAIVPDAPEKVLALRADRDQARPGIAEALVRALVAASRWAAEPGHRGDLVGILAGERGLGLPADLVRAILDGRLAAGPGEEDHVDPAYLRLDPDALRPERAHAAWLIERMHEAGQLAPDAGTEGLAVYRPDRFEMALAQG